MLIWVFEWDLFRSASCWLKVNRFHTEQNLLNFLFSRCLVSKMHVHEIKELQGLDRNNKVNWRTMITVYIQWDLNLCQKMLENAACYTYVFVLHVFILRICAVFSLTSNLPKIRKPPIECQVKRTIRLLPSHLDKKDK